MTHTNSILAAAIALALPLAACNKPDADRTTSIPAGAERATLDQNEPTGLTAPPAQADRTPYEFDPGAPGTQPPAELMAPARSSPPVVNADNDDHLAVQAQEAAAKAPDTASADAAKKKVLQDAQRMPGGAQDTPANAPRSGNLTPTEESTQMPKAGQANNHSSTALEKDSGR